MKLPHLLYKMILLSSLLCLLLSVSLSAADTTVGLSNFQRSKVYENGMFADVQTGAWFYQNVVEAYEYGLMQGTGSGFVPNGDISIVETIVTACRLHNIYNGGTHVFESTQSWEKPYIEYAVQNGIIGASDYSNYSAKATRAQFAEILANALPKEALAAINTVVDGAIPDVPVTAAYAEDVYLLYRAGIIIGNETNAFRADRQISRAEVAAILTRMANPDLRRSVTLTYDDPFPLVYTVSADGKSYTVTGCDSSAESVHIPSRFNGLPVTAIDGAAFVGCNSLQEFTVDADHPVFYTEDSVLFTDIPEKTLVRMPPAYSRNASYIAPAGTVHIAPYAFAGVVSKFETLTSITMQEGVRSLGDYAFASYQGQQLLIYAPDSLTEIGQNLTQLSKGNIPFYVSSWDTEMAKYAKQNNIPCGILHTNTSTDTELPASKIPECLPSQLMTETESEIFVVEIEEMNTILIERHMQVHFFYDFSKHRGFTGEVRLDLRDRWKTALPDAQGNVQSTYFTQTGIYGAGKTTGEAVLRGYDLDGNLVCMQRVSGNFAFAFPGAYQLGVEGGTDTKLTVLPIEPIFLENACDYPVYPDQWHRLPDGNISGWFVVCEPFVSFTHQNNDDRIWFGYMHLDAANDLQSYETSPNYHIIQFFTLNNIYVDALKYSVIKFDAMQTLHEDNDICIMKNRNLSVPDDFAEIVDACWSDVKNTMADIYFPAIPDTYKIYFLVNNKYPTCSQNIINVDTMSGKETFIHEMVHAVDHYIENNIGGNFSPSAWMEGRAEYITAKILSDSNPYEDMDWSFVSATEREDFFHFYYFSTNRITDYSVGYLFFQYLCDTYGENISLYILENISAVTEDMLFLKSDEKKALIFKNCITSVTDENVFQNFVRDVIEA